MVRLDGKLSLNLELCWSDVTTLQALTRQIEEIQTTHEASVSVLAALGERLMHVYRGPLLAQEGDKPWLLGSRDRMHSQFHRLVCSIGDALEAEQDTTDAIALYRKALERDNLSEEFYQRLMMCHRQRGEHADALNVYRRCRELLSIVLGVQPSQRTQQVYETLRTPNGHVPIHRAEADNRSRRGVKVK